ncbi:uncharacterized protein [Primulina eburnea]|uniref:uncharacterized protein n=1 Tax=Primulina eburnea TaxID=1245227 RepID=UPI003C6C67E7
METMETEISTPTWIIHVDGSSTPGGSGAGVLVESPQGDQFQYAIRFWFPVSNNEAEYEALIIRIKLALAAGARNLVAYSDSQLVVNQVLGDCEAKEIKMKGYLTKVNELLTCLENFEVKQIPRTENNTADRLVKLGSSITIIDNIKITLLSYDKDESEVGDLDILCAHEDEPSWRDEIVKYLLNGGLPSDPSKARKFIVRAARFTLIDGELYNRGTPNSYLKCLPLRQITCSDKFMREFAETTWAA